MSLKFGFGGPKKPAQLPAKPTPKKPVTFGHDASDDEESGPTSSTNPKKSKTTVSKYGDLSTQKTFRKAVDKALEVDPSIYDYDAAYDAIQAKNEAKKAAEREKAQQGQSKYMGNLLVAKTVREKDYLRAKESKMQREREEEGDEFADKEKFVTGAYKRQQEELRLQEEEEERREAAETMKRENGGQARFLKSILDQEAQIHSEAVAAASSGQPGQPKSEQEMEKSEAQIAKELNEKGANIELTDDGEIADKRQLLSAGLNVMAKPKHSTPSDLKPKQLLQLSQSSRPSNQKSSRDRQTRMIEAQLEQIMKRQADEEAEKVRQREHTAKSQKTSADIISARERYLQRKQAADAAKKSNNKDQPT